MNKNEDNDKKDFSAIKKKGKPFLGIILVISGIIFLLNNFGLTNFDIGKLWPLFLIVPGVMMLLEYFNS